MFSATDVGKYGFLRFERKRWAATARSGRHQRPCHTFNTVAPAIEVEGTDIMEKLIQDEGHIRFVVGKDFRLIVMPTPLLLVMIVVSRSKSEIEVVQEDLAQQ